MAEQYREDGVKPTVVTIGLGFAGMPTAMAIAGSGHQVIGVDLDETKIRAIRAGESVGGVDSASVRGLVEAGMLSATSDPEVLRGADVIVISVPTPLGQDGRPDQSAVDAVARTVIDRVRDGALVVLQSTVVPGTTRRLLVEPLEAAGRVIGKDVFVAYSPERVNPGDPVFKVTNTMKLVAGATPACLARATPFVASFVSEVHPVSQLEAAELSKLVENTFRFVNISFVNEVAILCDRLGVSVWEVIDAAATKPFSFLPHYPGPGVGGECIPVSPRYLEESALQHGYRFEAIPAAFSAMAAMAGHVADRCQAELGTTLDGKRIVVVGVAYKPGLADARHSPAVPLIHVLRERGAEVVILDPHVGSLMVDGITYVTVDPAGEWPGGIRGADAAIVVTAHPEVDHTVLAQATGLVLDTRRALHPDQAGRIVLL